MRNACPTWLAGLAFLAGSSWELVAGERRVRNYDVSSDIVWPAAVEVARDSFLMDGASREAGRLRFRTGPLRRYRFEVFIVETDASKTRLEIELRTNLRAIEKDAWRQGDRYLMLLTERIQGKGR